MPTTWVLHVDGDLDEVNRHWPELSGAGMVGAAEVDGRADVYFPERVDGLTLLGRWEQVPDRDWHERWRAGLTPVHAGRWTVTPSWLATGEDDELVIDPGQAFGTGHHETTLACLAALGAVDLAGRTLLDVGTGTGVLAIAAARAGAHATGVDTDPLAVEAATANAGRNDVAVEVLAGDIDLIAGRRFDVVVANLDSDTLQSVAGQLQAALADDGLLLGSGVSNERADEVAATLRAAGLDVEPATGGEWSLLRGRRHPW